MIKLLKEVARGKRGARDLTYDEALEAAEAILSLEATPAQIGAFFIAERIKLESVEELEAFVHVCRRNAVRAEPRGGIDCAGPYDGRKNSFYATFPASFLLAAAGLPVTLHGSASLPPKWGITLQDLIASAGVDPAGLTRDQSLRAAELSGVLYVSSEAWCPPLGRLRPIREELGMRTVLNTAEKLIDYGGSPYLAFGIYHNTVFDRLSRLLLKLGYRRAAIVQGSEGSEDLFIDRPTRVYLVENGEFRLQIVDPESYGIESPVPEKAWTPAEQLSVSEAVLRGEAEMAFTNQVLLNGAARLFLAERVGSIEEGLYTCKALLDNGSAYTAYLAWREAMLAGDAAAQQS
ncbi:anthranilate phosphoribosyltransferase [Cohnella lubricantis]|uniref:Anthranilate phosphoribosyltransferase n=1 Tax=Cohnella lubricantis TaxID=2163172 RepID=A0A841TCF4_9BACL|nr:anthranilate phosphoribosyltransferase [Cohnella lubricantis]MBB6676920.1 anthranilate phosphoribosyltransferase [Cohnella lubricantis]MBP2118324.1 anthranilate phosphoribosyltransferase [Cohnella lubricantis]